MLFIKYLAGVAILAGLLLACSVTTAQGAELDLSGASGVCRDNVNGTPGIDYGMSCAAAGFVDLGGGLYQFAGAIWTVTTTQPTESGYIDSFVRIMDESGDDYYVVDGHNTSAPSQQYLNDEVPGPELTHDVLSTSLVASDPFGGTSYDYYRFLLDISRTGTDPLLSLSGLQICTAGTGELVLDGTCANSTVPGAGTSVLKYDLDTNTGGPVVGVNDPAVGDAYWAGTSTRPASNNVLLDYNRNAGSESGDLWVYIPKTTLFPEGNITSTNDYLYLWSQFGLPAPYSNSGGYEEWAFMHSGFGSREVQLLVAAPEPATLVMLLTGLLIGAGAMRRRNRQKASQA